MAQYLALKFAAETKDAVRNVGVFTKSLGRLMLGAGKMALGTRGLNTAFLGLGSTLVGTATTLGLMGGAVETAALRSRLALDRIGVSAMGLAKNFQDAGRSATGLLPVAAKFARFGVAGDQLKAVTDVAFEMGFVLEIGSQKAGEALADIAGTMGLQTEPEVRRLASSLTMLERNFTGSFDSNVQLLKTLGSTAAHLQMNESALLGANTAMQNFGVSAGAAHSAVGELLNLTSLAPGYTDALAGSLGATSEQIDRFAKLKDSNERFRDLFRIMKNTAPEKLRFMLEDLFHIETADAFAIARMVHETDRMNEVFGIAAVSGDELADEMERSGKTLGGALRLLWENTRALAGSTGGELVPALTALVGVLSDVVKLIGSLSPETRGVGATVIGLTGAYIGLLGVLKTGIGLLRFVGLLPALGGAAAAAGGLATSGAAAASTVGELMAAGIIATPVIAEVGVAAGAASVGIGGMGVAATTAAPAVAGFGATIGGAVAVILPFIAVAALAAGAVYYIMDAMGALGDASEDSIGTWNRFTDVVSKGFGFWIEKAVDLKRSLFGSSFLHLKEGVADVMPGMNQLGQSFEAIGQTPGRVGIEAARPAGVDGRIPDPLNVITATERMLGAISPMLLGKQAFGGPAGSGPGREMGSPSPALGAAGAGEGPAGGSVRVVVPVTVEIDGHVLARSIAEYDLDLGRERYMGAPIETMRATGG